MPIRGIFRNEDSILAGRISRKLHAKLLKVCKERNISLVELINYDLARLHAPELIEYFDKFRNTPRYSFKRKKKVK